jgi:hypothetical protein
VLMHHLWEDGRRGAPGIPGCREEPWTFQMQRATQEFHLTNHHSSSMRCHIAIPNKRPRDRNVARNWP